MKKALIILCAISAFGAVAYGSKLIVNFFAPVVADRSLLSQAQAGTIVYDAGTGAFFGLPSTLAPTNPNNWIQLGGNSGGTSDAWVVGGIDYGTGAGGCIWRFANPVSITGTSIQYESNSADGDVFRLDAGTYVATLNWFNTLSQSVGISINADADIGNSILTLTSNQMLTRFYGIANTVSTGTVSFVAPQGARIRAHTDCVANGNTADDQFMFHITRIN